MKKILCLAMLIAMTACSSGKEKIVIYSPHADAVLEIAADRFEAETGIVVEFINLSTAIAVERIRSEKDKPLADILYGGSASFFEALKKEGLLVKSSPAWASAIDPAFYDAEGYWYAPMTSPAIMYYNTNNITEVPNDWYDITNAKYKGKLIWFAPGGGTINTFITVMGMNVSDKSGKDAAIQWYKDIDSNISEYYEQAGLSYQAMNSPVGGIGMFVLPPVAEGIYKFGYPWAIVPTKSGVINIIDSVGAIANSPNPSGAQKFMDWVGEVEIQTVLANEQSRIPTHPEALKNSPEWMRDFDLPAMKIDWLRVAEELPTWVKEYDDIRTK